MSPLGLVAAAAMVLQDDRRRRIADAIGDRLDRLAADLQTPPAQRTGHVPPR